MQARVSAMTGMGAVLMTANIVIALLTGGYFNLASANNPFLNIWSLSVEEQFYLFFPAVLIGSFVLARRGKPRAPLIIIGLLAVISLAVAVVGSSSIDMPQKMRIFLGFYSPVSRAWEFGAGAILALLRDRAPRTPFVVNLLAVMGCILLFASFFFITGDIPFPGLMTLLPVVGTVFLILAGSSRGHISPVSRVLATSPFVRVGDMSYSWYLWHWPAIVFTGKVISHQPAILAVAALLSLLPAAASYRWVENPLRHYTPSQRMQNGRVTLGFASKFIACVIVPSLAICGFYMIANSRGYWSSRIRGYQEIVDPLHVAHRAGCGDGFVPPIGGTACLWNADEHGVPIYLIGDSNADHLSEAVIAAGKRLGSPVMVVSKGGCSLVGGAWSNQSAAADAECQKFVNGTLALIAHSRPGIVIIGMSDSNWWIDGVQVGPSREHMLSDPAQIVRYLDGSLVDISRTIRDEGHKLLLVQPVPKYVTRDNKFLFDPDQCTIISVLAGRCPQRISVSVAFEDSRQAVARTAIATAAKASGSDLLDLRPAFCFRGRCSVWGKKRDVIVSRRRTFECRRQRGLVRHVFAKVEGHAEWHGAAACARFEIVQRVGFLVIG